MLANSRVSRVQGELRRGAGEARLGTGIAIRSAVFPTRKRLELGRLLLRMRGPAGSPGSERFRRPFPSLHVPQLDVTVFLAGKTVPGKIAEQRIDSLFQETFPLQPVKVGTTADGTI
jgi:hypothetical protein